MQPPMIMTATTPPITPQITAVLAPSDSETMSEDVSLVTSNSCIPKTDEVSEGVSLVISEDAVSELVVSEEMVSVAEYYC